MTTFEYIQKQKFIAILRHIAPQYVSRAAQALYDGGIRIFEVTFDPSDPATADTTADSIRQIRAMFGDEVSVGAGTVLTVDYAKAAQEAGAAFIVSPCTNADVIRYTKSAGMLSMPGAYTPTEIMNAYALGADIVKIFPILPDGEAYLKNVVSPLSHIPFVVTGGINPDTVEKFLNIGPVAVAAGATIVTRELCEQGAFGQITENAKAHLKNIR